MFKSENKKEMGRLWQKVGSIERAHEAQQSKIIDLEELSKTAPISEKEARTAANSASQYRNIVKKLKEGIKADSDSIQELLIELEESVQTAKHDVELLKESKNECVNSKNSIEQIKFELTEMNEEISNKVQFLNDIVAENRDLRDDLDSTKELLDESRNDHNKMKNLLKETANINNNVKGLHDEIYGYELQNEESEDETETTYVEGLKQKLEKSYSKLNESIEISSKELDSLNDNTEEKYKTTVADINESYNEFIDNCDKKYEKTHSRILKLLPAALTAGLSSAYDVKKQEEEKTQESAITSFRLAIVGLIVISLIPFGIDVYLITVLKEDLVKVISDTPKLLISILPLYFPVLWMAYSSNKKANLSKRLIEEYTHKGVLSKTFEGLSTQISDLEQNEISNELKVKLLFNLLEVNSENPGKLISNYNSTDHPLMDALDKSAKLADAIEKLSNIPGFSKLTKNLERKSKKIMEAADKRISAVLDDDDEKNPKNNINENSKSTVNI